jgi:hypothetical protein
LPSRPAILASARRAERNGVEGSAPLPFARCSFPRTGHPNCSTWNNSACCRGSNPRCDGDRNQNADGSRRHRTPACARGRAEHWAFSTCHHSLIHSVSQALILRTRLLSGPSERHPDLNAPEGRRGESLPRAKPKRIYRARFVHPHESGRVETLGKARANPRVSVRATPELFHVEQSCRLPTVLGFTDQCLCQFFATRHTDPYRPSQLFHVEQFPHLHPQAEPLSPPPGMPIQADTGSPLSRQNCSTWNNFSPSTRRPNPRRRPPDAYPGGCRLNPPTPKMFHVEQFLTLNPQAESLSPPPDAYPGGCRLTPLTPKLFHVEQFAQRGDPASVPQIHSLFVFHARNFPPRLLISFELPDFRNIFQPS